jgi:proteasome lid subunit RPN8/RPN11
MEGPDPFFVAIFIAALLATATAIKKLFTRNANTETEDEPEEEYDMVDTTAIYDNADANKLLEAKMQVLELAIRFHSPSESGAQLSADDIAKTARTWWDFIALKPDDDSEE